MTSPFGLPHHHNEGDGYDPEVSLQPGQGHGLPPVQEPYIKVMLEHPVDAEIVVMLPPGTTLGDAIKQVIDVAEANEERITVRSFFNRLRRRKGGGS